MPEIVVTTLWLLCTLGPPTAAPAAASHPPAPRPWLRSLLDSLPDVDLVSHLPALLPGLLGMLSDGNAEIRSACAKLLHVRECCGGAQSEGAGREGSFVWWGAAARLLGMLSNMQCCRALRPLRAGTAAAAGVGGKRAGDPEGGLQACAPVAWAPELAPSSCFSSELLSPSPSFPLHRSCFWRCRPAARTPTSPPWRWCWPSSWGSGGGRTPPR